MAADPETVAMMRKLLQEIADLRAGVVFHVHRCTDHTWRCTSPYCRSLETPCLEHGGGPLGLPPAYAVAPEYARA